MRWSEFGGHSSHVTTVKFLHDDSSLISTGGRDTATFQWNCAHEEEVEEEED